MRVRLHPFDGRVDVFFGLGKAKLRRHAVVDTEPREPGIREWLERRRHVGSTAATVESAAVHENRGGERARTVRHVKIEQE